MPDLRTVVATVLLVPVLGAAQEAAQTPHGTVIFQSPPAVVESAPPEVPEAAPVPVAPAKPLSRAEARKARRAAAAGISSSSGKQPTLHRHVETDAGYAPVTPPETVVEAAAAASSSSADVEQAGPIVVTTADEDAASRVTAAERAAVAIAATVLDLHLDTHTGEAEARAQLVVRNAGDVPLSHVALRISGALRWESARLNGATAKLVQYHLPDDLDHTGVATELALELPEPLAPGGEAKLDLYYSGVLAANDARLRKLGAPNDVAVRTDWDAVTDSFTGLRGVGNVLWYPVVEPPASLRDSAAVPAAVEHARASAAATPFALHLTVQYTGSKPEAAFFCGERTVLKPLDAAASRSAEGGAVVGDLPCPALGMHTPALFLAGGVPQTVAGGLVHVYTDRADAAAAVGEAAGKLRPMLEEWLGPRPARSLDVMDLPIPGAAGFADGALVIAPLTTGPAGSLAPAFVVPLTQAWLPAGIAAPWLREGIPVFMQSLWAERTAGREAALNGLAAQRKIVGTIAPARSAPTLSSSVDPVTLGTALAVCGDPGCARGKAASVLEMLRGMLGDGGLAQVLSGWRVAQESAAGTTAAEQTASFEALAQEVAGKRDLSWFFRDWVDENHGLPDLAIVTVAPRKVDRDAPTAYLPQKQRVGGPIGAEPVPLPGDPDSVAPRSATPGNRIAPAAGSWLVAVEVQNGGDADAEVPVTVRSGTLTNTLPLHVPAHGRATVRVPFEADPEEVLVNDGSVPEARSSVHRRTLTTR